jgi:hypothetical protein
VLQAGASALDELAVHPVAFDCEITMRERPS